MGLGRRQAAGRAGLPPPPADGGRNNVEEATAQGRTGGATPRAARVPCAPRGSRKEVFQPHLPVRLPCYDLAPVTGFALGRSSRPRTSGTPGSHGLTGGVYKARERIHRAMADARLLANPIRTGRGFRDSPRLAPKQPAVPPIVTRVSPRT